MVSLEQSIIGAIITDTLGSQRKWMIAHYKITPESFQENSARIAFAKFQSLDTEDNDIIQREIAAVVGSDYVIQACGAIPASPADGEALIRKLFNCTQARKIQEAANCETQPLIDGKVTPSFAAASLQSKLEQILNEAPGDDSTDGFNLSDYADPIPEDENPDALFRGGWFRKGQAMFLVSVSGSGKSVITMQFCYGWALGRDVLGTRPIRPMKIGVFQTEDDDEEVMEFRDSMRRGYREIHGWTDEDLNAAEKNIKFFNPEGKMGTEFLTYVRAVQSRHHFDLIVINPFQGVTGFDLAKNENLTNFLRKGVDPIIKGEKTKCGLFVVHHTNKPPNAQERARFGRDQLAQYISAGGAEVNNWMRGMLVIMPAEEPNSYRFMATKRGERLGWVTPPSLKAQHPTKILAHSLPDPNGRRLLFWLDKTDAAKSPAEVAMDATPEEDAIKMVEKLKGQRLNATDLRAACRNELRRKRGEIAFQYIHDNCRKLGIKEEIGANNNQKSYCFPG